MAPSHGTSGAQGTTFEARMCILLFVRGYIRGLKDFKLEYQVNDADKFDDVVFDDGTGSYQIIQLKHKENENQWKITHSNFFTEKFNTDFNLIKYVKAVINANSSDRFKDKVNAAVVLTNIPVNLTNDELRLITNQTPAAKVWYDGLTSIKLKPTRLDPSAIYEMSGSVPEAKYYKFTDDPNIVQILMRQAATLVRDVGTLTEDEIREALDKLIYAVEQPNVLKITEIIKSEIKDHFKLNDADSLYEKLETYFRDWCDTKNPLNQPSTSTQSNISKQQVLTFADADKIFQKHVKRISFEVTAPTDAFTGRVEELEKIRQQLKKESNLIVSSTLTISGLGGIGKTQLTKQFIKEFGQSEFYGRVMWIQAESDETVKNSFERLAQVLNIQDARNKVIKVLIHDVFQYFVGFKVLFVFDNFDKSPANDELLVTFCRETASGLTSDFRPYFLFTSRNRNCLPGVPLLDLNVLSPEDAVQLIQSELMVISPTEVDAAKLAEVLQYFPLALRQANAYIKEQHILGKRYEIQDYLKEFDKETKDLLTFPFPNDFGQNEKATFFTWNVTLDAIKSDKVHGKDAIRILKICAYLYADKIDPTMFLPLCNNDEDKTTRALFLLQKYSLVTKIQQESTTFYQIHRLVQTVVQLKFQKQEKSLQEQTFKLINPELHKEYFGNWFMKLVSRQNAQDLINKCSTDQIIHYNTLSVHMLKQERLKVKYEDFFIELNDKVLKDAAFSDDVEKLKAVKVTKEKLKRFSENDVEELLIRKSNKVIKYFVEIEALDVNDRIVRLDNKPLIKLATEHQNDELFKFLIEKDADLSEVLEIASVELISEIIKKETDSLQTLINEKPKDYQEILNECLFYATLFNQESILRVLAQNIDRPKLEYKSWLLICIAIKLKFDNIITILLQMSAEEQLKECLIELLTDKNFTDTKVFKIICKKYLEKSGDVCYLNRLLDIFLSDETKQSLVNVDKLELANILLDEGAYLTSSCYDRTALTKLLIAHENDRLSVDDKRRVDEFLNRMLCHNLTPDKFINISVGSLFEIQYWTINEYYRSLFERMVKRFGDINVRNENGETLLIKYLQNYRKREIETVKYLVEHGVDIEVQDNEKKDAFYYAALRKSVRDDFKLFEYLLGKVKSVDENVLEKVIEMDKREFVEKLRENHFSGDFCFKNGKSLIEVAVESVSPKVVLLLKDEFKKYREQGGDVNKRDEKGQTLLIKLFYDPNSWKSWCDVDIDDVKFLVENGINVDIRDKKGHSVLHYTGELKTKDIFLYLLENSKSVEEEALFGAIREGVLSKVQDLLQGFNKDRISNMTTRLFSYANRWEKSPINELEMDDETKGLLNDRNNKILWEAVKQDDIEKVKALEISSKSLKLFLKYLMENLMKQNRTEVIKYCIENGHLGVNDQIKEKTLLDWSTEHRNIELFKFLIEKDADLSESLEVASLQLISEIIKGDTVLFQTLINEKPENYQEILNECLFFAMIFNQESIVLILAQNLNQPDLKYKKWSLLVDVAARLKLKNILAILVQISNQRQLEENLIECWENTNSTDKEAFKSICKKYLEKGGDVNSLNKMLETFLRNAIINYDISEYKLDFASILLDEGADLDLSPGAFGLDVLKVLLEKHEDDRLSVDDKRCIDKLLNFVIFHNLTPNKFIHVSVRALFWGYDWSTKKYYRNLFEKMVKEIGGINVRNEKGETLLIKYLEFYSIAYLETVKYLVEHGIDIEAQDNEGKPALYYAVKEFKILKYLLAKVESVDENVLENAIKNDNKASVQKLLEKHFSPDYRFKNGKTVIEVAVEKFSLKIILLLKDEFKKYRERGGDVNKRDEKGRTFLIQHVSNFAQFGGFHGYRDTKFLVEAGVNVDIRDDEGCSALFFAAWPETYDVFLYLLKHSKSVDEKALFEAITTGALTKVEELPQDFDKDRILRLEKRLLEHANEYSSNYRKRTIIDFLNQLKKIQ